MRIIGITTKTVWVVLIPQGISQVPNKVRTSSCLIDHPVGLQFQ